MEIVQILVSVLTAVALIATMRYQNDTSKVQKSTLNILQKEERIKEMPYFTILKDAELAKNVTIGQELHAIKLMKTTAYDIRFKTVSERPYYKGELNTTSYDITEPETVITLPYVDVVETVVTTANSRNSKQPVLEIRFEDYSERKYLQEMYLQDSQLRISKPMLIS